MDRVLEFSEYSGEVVIPSSKSELHRLLFLSSLSDFDKVTVAYSGSLCKDVMATVTSLRALGANIKVEKNEIVFSKPSLSICNTLDVSESGTTLRFILPRIGYFAENVSVQMHGRLSQRPIDDFLEQLREHGMSFEKDGDIIKVSGKLRAGEFILPGSVSSQYISSLLLTLPFLEEDSIIRINGKLESFPYIQLTLDLLKDAGVTVNFDGRNFYISASSHIRKTSFAAFGDYSSATFFACLGAFSSKGIWIKGLDVSSSQGDRKIFDILEQYGAYVQKGQDGFFVQKSKMLPLKVDASDVPDMVMALCVLCANAQGRSVISNCSRLKLKESDRIEAVMNMLRAFGVSVSWDDNDLTITGQKEYREAVVDSYGDHRIAMAASIFSSISENKITICNASCVDKSYPDFFRDLESLRQR